jgi:hypothetical protein
MPRNLLVKDHVKLYIHVGQASLIQRFSRGSNTFVESSLIVLIIHLKIQTFFKTTQVLHLFDCTMPSPHRVFARQTTQLLTTGHHHVHLDDDDCLFEHPRTKWGPDNVYSLSVNSDEEQDCSHDPQVDDEDDEDGADGDKTWEEEDYMHGDDNNGNIHCVGYQRCTDDGCHGIMSHGVVSNDECFDCKKYVPISNANATSKTPESNVPSLIQKSRLRNLAGKAKEHLCDEQNRRKAVIMFQTGVREVATFIADIQASDKANIGAVGQGNGKKLAKVYLKVAMQRLAK